jgi:phosphomevalonate kinase
LAQLELRAQQAGPRDQCFLYTELVNTMTEIAGRQMLNGDVDQASVTLKKVNHYAQLIHLDLASNSKRLKNAEMLLHHTTYRLGEYLHKASSEDQDTLKTTLKQLDKVHEELLAEVMKH